MKTKILLLAGLLLASLSCKKEGKPPYPKDGLISYFNFDDNFKDQQLNTEDGVPIGDPVFVEGKRGKAISFDGNSQGVNFIKKNDNASTQVSVSVWVRCTNSVNSVAYFFVGSKFLSFLGLFQTSSDVLGMSVQVNPGGMNNAQTVVANSMWTHVTGTYDGTFIRLYINGELKAIKSHEGSIKGYVEGFDIGAFNQNYWAGSIDELYLYNRALSQAEVTQLYNLN